MTNKLFDDSGFETAIEKSSKKSNKKKKFISNSYFLDWIPREKLLRYLSIDFSISYDEAVNIAQKMLLSGDAQFKTMKIGLNSEVSYYRLLKRVDENTIKNN